MRARPSPWWQFQRLSNCNIVNAPAQKMHSYMEQVSLPVRLPDLDRLVEERKAGERRPMRLAVVAASLAVIACVAVLMVVGEGNRGTSVVLDEVAKPKFVDWKKEDAGSDDMNLHLKVAESLAKVSPSVISPHIELTR